MRKAYKILLGVFLLLLPILIWADQRLLPSMILIPEVKETEYLISKVLIEDGIDVRHYFTTSFDNLKLDMALVETDSARGTIILLHGVGNSKGALSAKAKWLHSIGFNALLVDQRAHGKSEGKYCTYGFHEQKDVSAIVDMLEANKVPGPYGVWGISMGGSVATLSLASEPRLSFGIIQSTFCNLNEIVADYQSKIFGFPMPYLANRGLSQAGKLADFDPKKVNPLELIKTISQPVFISHGDADEFIKFEYGEQLFNAVSHTNKIFYAVPNAGHLDWWEMGAEEYKSALSDFLNSLIN
ncbi:MAG: alpha-beta hydrolase superfamily lysophospholipase [Limisphaerales bacterium]|jgi:alpha-beta hydrolase superfamily lysophospholipase